LEFIENTEKLTCICKTDKMLKPLTIRKAQDGFVFFEVTSEVGVLPKELTGKYTSMPKAREAVAQYFRTMKETIGVRRENFGKDFDERKKVRDAAKSITKDSKYIHQGVGNGEG
jgi:hypothetical protein